MNNSHTHTARERKEEHAMQSVMEFNGMRTTE